MHIYIGLHVLEMFKWVLTIGYFDVQVTDWKGSELDFAADEKERRVLFPSGGILVTNDGLHDQILEIISTQLMTTWFNLLIHHG